MKLLIKLVLIVGIFSFFFWKFDWYFKKSPIKEVDVTLIEGWTSKQMAKQLEKSGLASASDILALVSSPTPKIIQRHPELAGSNLEGFLFPDTYRFYGSTTPEEIVKRMVDNFFVRLPVNWQADAKKQNLSLKEVVTLASIIEKEVAKDSDRKIVADIFLKRLKVKQPLQSDATINYITGNNSLQPSAKELSVKSLYNTYDQIGLPPGPINNPSLSSLLAVLQPVPNAYYYFLTTPQGELKTATSYQDHLANKRKYLR